MTDPLIRTARDDLDSLRPGLESFAANMGEAFRQYVAAFRTAAKTFHRGVDHLLEQARARANDPVNVAGLEGRYAVRAGLDPAYATPEACGRLVRSILNGRTLQGDPMYLLTPGNRALVAAAAIRGWEAGYPGAAPEVLAWHRQHGDTRVLVGRA